MYATQQHRSLEVTLLTIGALLLVAASLWPLLVFAQLLVRLEALAVSRTGRGRKHPLGLLQHRLGRSNGMTATAVAS